MKRGDYQVELYSIKTMTKFPSESWYGSEGGTLETQLRYTPFKADAPLPLHKRVWRALRTSEFTLLERDVKAGLFWLRIALLLALLGMVLQVDFLLVAGLCGLTFVGLGWLWDAVSLIGLHYHRELQETRAFLGETVDLTLTVHNMKPLPLMTLEIEDVFPVTLPVDGAEVAFNRITNRGEFHTFWMPGMFQRLKRHYAVQCVKRGYHFFGPTKVWVGDGAGLFSRTVYLSNEQVLIVYPRLYAAAELRLPAKNPFGEWSSKQRLFEDPLRPAGIRPWQPGDGMRRIHWKATARQLRLGQNQRTRHQQMLSRVYEPSEVPQVLIFLNVATLERYWEGVIPELVERTISVAGSLASLCVEQRLPVGLIANANWPGSDQTMRLLPGRSPAQLTHILEMLAAVDLPSRPIETQLMREAPRLPWGATLLVVTAVAHDALLGTVQQLARAGRKVVLFTLAAAPPADFLLDVKVYHLPHLVDALVAPLEVA